MRIVIKPKKLGKNRFASPPSPALSRYGADIVNMVKNNIAASIIPTLFHGFSMAFFCLDCISIVFDI